MILFAVICLCCAAIPAALFLFNLFLYRIPSSDVSGPRLGVSVLIPARNEESNVVEAIGSVLGQSGLDLEVLILDDDSTDSTARRVQEIAALDSRVRLLRGRPLPEGWCGKMFACHQLASAASNPVLVFMDADVRLLPGGLLRATRFLVNGEASLISGIPAQRTETFWEKALIPLIHFVLLGFLPLFRMRKTTHPAYGAGCGQLFLARRNDYLASGGHRAIASSRHDGLKLPRLFREHGFDTDLFDATKTAHCRMYENAAGVWHGLAKNATEGLGAPRVILPMSGLLLLGQVIPALACLFAWINHWEQSVTLMFAIATALGFLPRLAGAWRFEQSPVSVLLHPLGVASLVAIQWWAWVKKLSGKPMLWKGRGQTDGGKLSRVEVPRPDALIQQPTKAARLSP